MRISESFPTTAGISHCVQVSTEEAEVIAEAADRLYPWVASPAVRHVKFRTSRQLSSGFQFWRISERDLAHLAAKTGLPVFVGPAIERI